MATETKRVRFTKTAINQLPTPESGRVYWYDTETRGLTCCIWPTGSRVFYLYRKIDGKPEREKLGTWPEMTVEQARDAVDIHVGRIKEGQNPAARRRQKAGAPTLAEVFEQFIEAPSRTKAKRTRSPITTKGYRYLFDEHLASWSDRQISKITRAETERLHSRIGSETPYLANRVLSLLKAIFGYCQEHGLHDGNPAARLRPFAEQERERFLQAAELPQFFAALEADPNVKMKDFVKLLLFTGQRRTNVLQMRWDDIDLAGGIWLIPKTKSGRPLAVPLTAPALEVLVRRSAIKEGEYVLPGRHGGEHLKSPEREWRGILARAGIKHLRLHDLRRTFGSWQAATGASLPTIGKSLGHSTAASTAIYARLELGPIREAAGAAVAAIQAAGKPAPAQEEGATNGQA